MAFNYLDEVTDDAINYVRDNYSSDEIAEKLTNRDRFADELYEAMWVADEVTGNASGSYTFNTLRARDYVLADPETVLEAIEEFCCDANEVLRKALNGNWEWFDVTARCWVLYRAIDDVLDILENE